MGVRAGPIANPCRGVISGALGDTCKHGQLHQLQIRRGVGLSRATVSRPQDAVWAHPDIVEFRCAAGRQPLSEAIPVVMLGDAVGVCVDEHRHTFAVLVRGDQDVVRIQRPGAVVLRAVEHPLVAVAGQARLIPVHGTHARLGDRVADENTTGSRTKPGVTGVAHLGEPLILDETEVDTQRLWKVRFRRGEVDEKSELLAHSGPEPAELNGHPQRSETQFT